MNKLTLIFIVFWGVSINSLFSQSNTNNPLPEYQIKDFEILIPDYRIPNSLYHSIEVVDSRIDKKNLGIVQLGAFNHQAEVIPKIPFSIQLQKVIQSITDSLAKNGELLLQFRQFKFAEVTAGLSEKGYCALQATIYSKNGSQYQKLTAIDTILMVKSMDVTKALLNDGSKLITDFIAHNLLKETTDSRIYSHRDIVKIDSTEKREILVYNTDHYVEGLYYNYQSFSSQKPDKHIVVEAKKNGKISCVKMNGADNTLIKVDPEEVYAIVYNGKPYMATPFGYYPLIKSRGDFYFTGKIKVAASTGDFATAYWTLGVVGVVLVANANARYEMKLDHRNGRFIRIREVVYD